jgi:hypothetical protein
LTKCECVNVFSATLFRCPASPPCAPLCPSRFLTSTSLPLVRCSFCCASSPARLSVHFLYISPLSLPPFPFTYRPSSHRPRLLLPARKPGSNIHAFLSPFGTSVATTSILLHVTYPSSLLPSLPPHTRSHPLAHRPSSPLPLVALAPLSPSPSLFHPLHIHPCLVSSSLRPLPSLPPRARA